MIFTKSSTYRAIAGYCANLDFLDKISTSYRKRVLYARGECGAATSLKGRILMYSAITVADEFLKIAKRNNKMLSPMQLMKLVYIAHGWALAVLQRDLFSNRIEAWKYGPVIPDLYQATKQFGRDPIPLTLIDEAADSGIDTPTKAFLEDVYSKYGHLSAIDLSNLTHQSGTPWDQRYESWAKGIEIPNDLIAQHYIEKLNEHRRSTTTA